MKKNEILNANMKISMIEDLLEKAENLLYEIPNEIMDAILNYHNENTTLPHCLRWGLRATKDIRKDWHTVVSKIYIDQEKTNPFKNYDINSNGINSLICARLLPESEMRKLGFTDCNKDTWYYCKILDKKMDISFSVSINKNNPDDFRIDILNEDFCQPYDYQSILMKDPDFSPALKIQEAVEREMEYLQQAGVFSGHIRGEYI